MKRRPSVCHTVLRAACCVPTHRRHAARGTQHGLLLLAVLAVGGCDQIRERFVDRAAPPQTRMEAMLIGPEAPYQGRATAPLPPEDGQWTMAAKNHANTRFSGLTEITTGNAARLELAWSYSTGNLRGHEGAPLVVGSTMYLVSPFPHKVVALDLGRPGAPQKWLYQPPFMHEAKGVACCDWVNRGPVFADGRIFFVTLDNQAIALDAETGNELWRRVLGDLNKGETMTMSPVVVKGKVIVGNSGGEMGVRGWLRGLDAATGAITWTAYGTGRDADVLIGSRFRPFYAKDRGRDLGVTTWGPNQWEQGGATSWGWISYDPELDLLYHGTANPGPWNPELRPGDNKWSAAMFARDPDTGEAVWAYQFEPHDEQDYDATNESILLDVPFQGRMRRALIRHEKNGFIYLMDRATGEILAADSSGHNTATLSIDLETGLPIKNLAKSVHTGRVTREICPAAPGSKDWSPASFSPMTGLMYSPFNHLCMDAEGLEASYIAGTPYLGTTHVFYAGPGGHRGGVFAWDPVERRKAWEIREPFPVWSGTLATAGGLVFYGTMDRWFKAVDARTGRTLWRFRTGSGIIGQPVTFRAPDGKQYVAIFDGIGGWPGSIVSGDLSVEDPTAAGGWGGALQDLPGVTGKGGTLYVFGVP